MTGTRRVWILNVCLAATAAYAFLAWVRPLPELDAPVGVPWLVLVAMFGMGEVFAVHVQVRKEAQSFSVSEIPLVLGLFFASPSELVSAWVVGATAALLIHRRQPAVKLAFNVSQYFIATSLAAMMFHLVLGSGDPLGPRGWGAAIAATLITEVVSAFAITLALSLVEGRLRAQALAGLPGLWIVATLLSTGLALLAMTVIWRDPRAAWLLVVAGGVLVLTYRGYATTRQRYGSLQLLYESTRVVQAPLAEGSVVPGMLRQLCAMFRAESAEIKFFPQSGGDAAVIMSLQAAEDEVRTEHVRLDPTDGVWARVASEAQALLVPRPIRSERLRAHFAARGIRDAMVAPLFVSARVAGTIMVANRLGDVSTFDAEDLKLFETFANHASVTVHNGELVDGLRRQAAQNEYQALHDGLTGLPNRTLLRARSEQAIADARREGGRVAVLMIDLDRFKEINDTLGHHNGDLLLKEMAQRLRDVMRDGDTVARLGGDEFALVVTRVGDPLDAIRAAERARTSLEQPLVLQDVTLDVGASIGITLYPEHGEDPDTLMQRADVAMYLAKADQSGVEMYSPERDRYSPARLALVGELRHAIEGDGLMLHYQPKADLRTGRVTGVEALVRWNHLRQGIVTPDEFIPLAEQTGLIRPLTLRVLETALADRARWAAAGIELNVAVNISARTLVDQQLPDEVARRLAAAGVPASALTLEVTETSIMADPARSIGILARLSAMGVGLSIDDFGTGYSSLSYLKRLPVDEVKIDRSFVMAMAAEDDDAMIVRSIIDLGRTLRLRVVAEGVESEQQWNQLRMLGCEIAQGFLLSRPMPAQKVLPWIARFETKQAVRPDRSGEPGARLALVDPA